MGPGSKRSTAKKARTVLRTFRLPSQLDEALVSYSKQDKLTLTDQLVSILTKYVEYDRDAQKFGFVSFGRGTFERFLGALPEGILAELASSSAVDVIEYIDFRYQKRDLPSLLSAIGVFSKYQRRFDYESTEDESGVTIVMRTDMGEKFVTFLTERWKAAIAAVLGATPLVEREKNQVTFKITNKAPPSTE
jgi:hypothetical protein